jgi:hypothetical protein
VVLDSDDHEHFIRYGYLVIRQAVPADLTTAAVLALEAEPEDHRDAMEAVAACTTEKMLDAIDELFGPGYTLQRRRGGSDMPRPYQPDEPWPDPVAHVDDSYPSMMPNGWAVGSFIFLTDVQYHGGAFIYFPGSYMRYREEMARNCGAIKGAAPLPEFSGHYEEYLAQAGDVLLFHHLTGHTGSTNVTDHNTRHAILNRWHPVEMVNPGDKPFERMTTIEKVNSARYLSTRLDQFLSVLRAPITKAEELILKDGIVLGDCLMSYAIIHFNGKLQLLYVDERTPSVIRRSVSEDFVSYSEIAPVPIESDGIRTVQLHQYHREVILAVTTSSGKLAIYESKDMESWTLLSEQSGISTATPWYIYPEYPSKIAGGQALFYVPAAEPSTAICSWGEEWENATDWPTESIAMTAPENLKISDITIAAHFGDSKCTILVDTKSSSVSPSLPQYTQPEDVAVAGKSLEELPFECASSPSRIRVLNRGRSLWFVSYILSGSNGDRLFYGYINWETTTPSLVSIETGAALNSIAGKVGFI